MNQLLTIGEVTMEGLPVLENQLNFAKHVRRDFDGEFGNEGRQVGDQISVRKPPRFGGRSGQGFNAEDAIETSVPLVLTNQDGVDTFFTSKDFAVNIENFSTRFLYPAMARISNKVDANGLLQYLNVANFVGVPGTVPNALLTYLQAQQKLDDNATDRSDRNIVISQAMLPQIIDSLKGLLNPSGTIGSQYDSGMMVNAIGADWEMDQNVASNTTGALNGATALTINAGGQSGASLSINNAGSVTAVLKKGNTFTIGSGSTGCYAVNPQEKTQINSLQCFTVMADVTSSGGAATVPIFPAIVLSGPFQNVNAAPGAGAVINVSGAAGTVSPQGLCFHKGAFVLAVADLPIIPNQPACERKASPQLGLSMRYLKAYDYNTDRLPGRFDILYGWQTLYGETACRIMS